MIINPKKIIEMNAVKNVDPDALQPNSIDLTLHSAEHILDHGVLYKTAKRLPLTAKVRSDGRMLTFDSYQCYSVTFNEHVKVPENMVGFIVCRSSLNRMGAFITSGLYDSGFDNYIGAVLRTDCNIEVEINARIATIYFMEADAAHKYDGQYQKKDEEKS